MARGKKKRSYRRKPNISVAVVGGLVPGVIDAWNNGRAYGIQSGMDKLLQNYTGFSTKEGQKTFDGARLLKGLVPAFAGVAVHKIAARLGVNRMLASMKIPLLRV